MASSTGTGVVGVELGDEDLNPIEDHDVGNTSVPEVEVNDVASEVIVRMSSSLEEKSVYIAMEGPSSSTPPATISYPDIDSTLLQVKSNEIIFKRSIDDWVPKNGMEFDSREEAWKFWVHYGGKMGFGVRKDYSNKNRKDEVVTLKILCATKKVFGRLINVAICIRLLESRQERVVM
ncbi:hypothetical protein RJ639_030170 [Escallonia herrerae]|uniref:Uncharacterized protein n=1 Tax=Escallonia herrerae TaxID=1293975 RepID=A0AA89BDW1_9ASTE|nr:hypothetical protein RJ639_030170 [Escallonia herrerae]